MAAQLPRRSFLVGGGALLASSLASRPAFAAPASPGAGSPAPAAQRGAGVEVQLLNITDLHGYLQPPTPAQGGLITADDGRTIAVGGAGYLAAHLKRLRRGHRNSILFSSGDSFSGWPFEVDVHANEPTIEVLNALGLRFSTIGNHELDRSVRFLLEHMEKGHPSGPDGGFPDSTGRRFRGASFRFLTANVAWRDTGARIAPPYTVEWVDAGGGRRLPVGFIHLTVPGTETGSTSYQPRLISLDPVRTANRCAAELRRRGINALVVSIHDGGTVDRGGPSAGRLRGPVSEYAARLSPDIAAIFTGHWHHRFTVMVPGPDGVPRPVVEAGCHGQVINETRLTLDRRTGRVVRELTVSANHPVTRDLPADPEVRRIADYWTAQGRKRHAIPLARQTADFTSTPDQAGQTTMGNLAADWALWEARQIPGNTVDLSLVALRPPVGATPFAADLRYRKGTDPADADGVILLGEAWKAFGYGDPVLTVTVTGAQLHAALEQQWQPRPGDAPSLPGQPLFAPFAVSANVRAAYDVSRPVGDRVDPADVVISGTPLDLAAGYRLAALAYTLVGADGYTAFAGFTHPVRSERRDHESFIAYLRAHPVVSPTPLDRVRILSGPSRTAAQVTEERSATGAREVDRVR